MRSVLQRTCCYDPCIEQSFLHQNLCRCLLASSSLVPIRAIGFSIRLAEVQQSVLLLVFANEDYHSIRSLLDADLVCVWLLEFSDADVAVGCAACFVVIVLVVVFGHVKGG